MSKDAINSSWCWPVSYCICGFQNPAPLAQSCIKSVVAFVVLSPKNMRKVNCWLSSPWSGCKWSFSSSGLWPRGSEANSKSSWRWSCLPPVCQRLLGLWWCQQQETSARVSSSWGTRVEQQRCRYWVSSGLELTGALAAAWVQGRTGATWATPVGFALAAVSVHAGTSCPKTVFCWPMTFEKGRSQIL